MIRVLIHVFGLGILLLASCKSTDSSSELQSGLQSNSSVGQIAFIYPECLAAKCTSSDKQKEAANSAFERNVVGIIDNAQKTIKFSMYTFSNKSIYQALIAAAERGVSIIGIVDDGLFRNLENICTSNGCDFKNVADYIAATEKAIQDLEATVPVDDRAKSKKESKLKLYTTRLKYLRAIQLIVLDPSYLNLTITKRADYLEEPANGVTSLSRAMKLALALHQAGNTKHVVRYAPGKSRIVHNKLILADDKKLMTGSGNWSSTGLTINLENQFTTESPDYVRPFICMMAAFTDPKTPFHQGVKGCQTKLVAFAPAEYESNGLNQIQIMLYEAIDSAQKSIDISMHHLTQATVFAKLEQALDRGVKLRILFDDDDCNGGGDPNSKAKFEQLLAKGAKYRYFPTNCSIFQLSHNKFGIFDQNLVVNGSGNWSKAGTTKNYENFLKLTDPGLTDQFNRFFDQAWTRALTRSQCQCDDATEECRRNYCMDRKF